MFMILLGPLTLWSCGNPEPDPKRKPPETVPTSSVTSLVAPVWPFALPILDSDEMVRGNAATVWIVGTPPGAAVTVLQSTLGMGVGPCETGMAECAGILA